MCGKPLISEDVWCDDCTLCLCVATRFAINILCISADYFITLFHWFWIWLLGVWRTISVRLYRASTYYLSTHWSLLFIGSRLYTTLYIYHLLTFLRFLLIDHHSRCASYIVSLCSYSCTPITASLLVLHGYLYFGALFSSWNHSMCSRFAMFNPLIIARK